MELATLLGGLAQTLGLPPMEMDSRGYYPLAVDDMALLLYPAPDGDSVAIIGHIGAVEPDDFDRLKALLAGNLGQSSGAHLSVDVNGNVLLILWLALGNMEFTRFSGALEKFVNDQEFWFNYMKSDPPPSLTMAETVALSLGN